MYYVKYSGQTIMENGKMMTLPQVQAALADRRLTVVARETGLAYDTVWRVASGRAKAVSYDVVERLSRYLEDTNVVQ